MADHATLTHVGVTGVIADHTHAATGTGATGGGATLTPVNLNVPVATPATTEGRTGWDGTLRNLLAFDSVRAKPVTPVGFQQVAYPIGYDATGATATAKNLAAVVAGNGEAMLIPIVLAAPMFLKAYRMWSTDTAANARTAEARLYVSRLDNSATVNFVTGSDATFSFTPAGAAAGRSSADVSGAGTLLLPPGAYWLVIRNTSATQVFGIGTLATILGIAANAVLAIAALGTTLDIETSWAKSAAIPGVALMAYNSSHGGAW
jgi:hypothetical protein